MAVPRDGETLCPTGAVVLRGRRGVLERRGPRSTWNTGQCTWCGKPVPKGRKTWCSQWCVDAYRATQPEWQRVAVEERDHGVCANCGLDVDRMQRVCHRYYRVRQRFLGPWRVCERLAEMLTLRGYPTSADNIQHLLRSRRSWWDMDHQVPIADGGHPYDRRNLQTLCWWCHKATTAQEATWRAERRRRFRERERSQLKLPI